MTTTRRKPRFWTKDEIRTLLDVWETISIADIAKKLDRDTSAIMTKVAEIRKAGYNLPKKAHKGGQAKALLMEVLRERRLI